MSEILKRILNLKRSEMLVFIETALQMEEGKPFFIILKQASPSLRDEFYKSLTQDEVAWAKKYLEKIVNIDYAELKSAENKLNVIMDKLGDKLEEFKRLEAKNKKLIKTQRDFMKALNHEKPGLSDQIKGIPYPPIEEGFPEDSELIDLPKPDKSILVKDNIFDCIYDRFSRRKFTNEPLKLDELSYLLWATQGVKKLAADGKISMRTVPSAGARHPFETYLAVNNIENLEPGVYRYLPLEHKLLFLFKAENQADKLIKATYEQRFCGECAVTFFWVCIPYRCEWRYTITAHKVMLLDAGHICQNLYLACESIKCGTCAVGAYSQKLADEFLKLDGENEFVVYIAPVGRLKNS